MNRDQYVEALKSKLDEWNEQIGKTESQMKAASTEAQSRYEVQISEMKEHASTAQEKLQALVNSHSEDWEKHQANFEKAWGDISAGFGRAWSQFH